MASAAMANVTSCLALSPISLSRGLQGRSCIASSLVFSLSRRLKQSSCRAADQFSGRRQGLKTGRHIFLTGEQHYKRWMPTSETERHLPGSFQESPREEEEEDEVQVSVTQVGESIICLQAVKGGDVRSDEREEKEDVLQEEKEVQLSSVRADISGGEIGKDLLVEFLKKRGALGSATTRPFVGKTSISPKIRRKNPQRAKRNFKRYQKQGPRRGSERAQALWKEREKHGIPTL